MAVKKAKGMDYQARLSSGEVNAMLSKEVANGMRNPEVKAHDHNEDQMIDALDEKAMVIEVMREFVPIYKRMKGLKDVESILNMTSPVATKMLAKLVLFGSEKTQLGAIKETLDRTMGKPVERQINLNGDINTLKEMEVDRELARILNKVGFDDGTDIVVGEDGGNDAATEARSPKTRPN